MLYYMVSSPTTALASFLVVILGLASIAVSFCPAYFLAASLGMASFSAITMGTVSLVVGLLTLLVSWMRGVLCVSRHRNGTYGTWNDALLVWHCLPE